MSPETDQPRQRTVAELLAQHGDAGATGRRRRRREADGDEEEARPVNGNGNGAAPWHVAPAPEPDRSVLRERVADPQAREQGGRRRAPEPEPLEPMPWEVPAREAPSRETPLPNFAVESDQGRPPPPAARRSAPAPEPVRERPTEQIPRFREEAAADAGLTAPIQQQRPVDDAEPQHDAADDGGRSTMVGAAPAGAEAWHRARTASRRDEPDDGGPPTEAAAPVDFDDRPAGLGAADLDEAEPAYADEPDDEAAGAERPRRGLRQMAEGSAGQAWAAVLAQWIAGALGGAVLWVAFRFLWRSLPVVALAAAVLVTVGLVVVVRALLRNDDMRTTAFAVLVGLLLTVSPAILVLLGQ
ncbi:hypothetical protein [Pseudonocardia nigra]|uniref:hypothetical protein n=1 Tax=Pseudonocardia nigra TaxID=1921578 RepID=UPI001C5DEA76|nr:hypothetical protein [Pseudonocardia nigra]